MQQKVPYQLIDRYLNGDCSFKEEEALIDWYNSPNEQIDPILLLTERQKQELKFVMLDQLRNKVYLDLSPKKLVHPFKKYYYAEASVAAAFVTLFSVFIFNSKQNFTRTVILSPIGSKQVNFTNNLTKLYKHSFPDGSIVWLKPNASIRYNTAFVRKTREVNFAGEAFFEVKKDSKHPFIIHSGGIVTKVLGTSFNERAYSNSKNVEVSVATGKVLVYTASNYKTSQSVYLFPEQKVTYLRGKNELIRHEIKTAALGIWKKSTLSLDNTSVSDVVQTLNKQFQSNIILSDQEISHYTLKADFTDVNLPTILELLCKSLNISYQIQDDKIIVLK